VQHRGSAIPRLGAKRIHASNTELVLPARDRALSDPKNRGDVFIASAIGGQENRSCPKPLSGTRGHPSRQNHTIHFRYLLEHGRLVQFMFILSLRKPLQECRAAPTHRTAEFPPWRPICLCMLGQSTQPDERIDYFFLLRLGTANAQRLAALPDGSELLPKSRRPSHRRKWVFFTGPSLVRNENGVNGKTCKMSVWSQWGN
jgi:hypothetical protein